VWDIRACHSICHNFLPTPRGKTKVWIWKHEEFVAISSSEELSMKALV
jgi:hypothetical protein